MTDILHFDLSGPDGDDDVLIQIGDGPLHRVRGPVTIGRCRPPHEVSFTVKADPKAGEHAGRHVMIGGERCRLLAPDEVAGFLKENGIPFAWRYPRS